jgi:TolA-binding protein
MQRKFLILAVIVATFLTVQAQTPVELAQGVKGITPTVYYELSREAKRFFEQKDYAKAAEAFAKLTAAYPYNGETRHLLGRALYENKQFKQAAESFQTAYKFGTLVQGFGQLNTAGYAALAFAKANEPELDARMDRTRNS